MADYIKASDLALLTEGYELTMADGFMGAGMKDTVAYFDLFFRRVPDNGGFAIAAGLSKVIDYLEHLHFREEDIKYLKSKGISDELCAVLFFQRQGASSYVRTGPKQKEYKHRLCFYLAVVYFIRSFYICRYFQACGDVSV